MPTLYQAGNNETAKRKAITTDTLTPGRPWK